MSIRLSPALEVWVEQYGMVLKASLGHKLFALWSRTAPEQGGHRLHLLLPHGAAGQPHIE